MQRSRTSAQEPERPRIPAYADRHLGDRAGPQGLAVRSEPTGTDEARIIVDDAYA